MSNYFCHQCNIQKNGSQVSSANNNMTLICQTCGSDFVEEFNDDSRQELSSGSEPGQAAEGAVGLAGPLFDLDSDPLLRPFAPRLQQLLPTAFQHDLFGSLPVFSFGMDRVIDMLDSGALNHVMTQLLSQVDSAGAPPPATPAELARIRRVAVQEGQVSAGLQCSVCLDEFRLGDTAERLPCQHHFHCPCIRPWLEKRGTCPVCRKSLSDPGHDAGGGADDPQPAAAPEPEGPRSSSGRPRSGLLEDDCD